MVTVFCSYSHGDEELLKELRDYIGDLQEIGLVREILYDKQIAGGEDWEESVESMLRRSHIILLLITPNFTRSRYIVRREVPLALELLGGNRCRIIPIIASSADMRVLGDQIESLHYLPSGRQGPIDQWPNRSSAFGAVKDGIENAILSALGVDLEPDVGRERLSRTQISRAMNEIGVTSNDIRARMEKVARRGQSEPDLSRGHGVAAAVGGLVATIAVIATVIFVVSHLRSEPATASVTTAPPPSTEAAAPDASTELRRESASDREVAEQLVAKWTPQISTRKDGMVVKGTSDTYDDARIWNEFANSKSLHREAILLWSGDFSSFGGPNYWITIVALPFPTADAANSWCDQNKYPSGECFAKRLSHTDGSARNTVYR